MENLVAIIKYKNESGQACEATIHDCDSLDHYYWTSKRNITGQYEKRYVTRLGAFLNLLPKKTPLSLKVIFRDEYNKEQRSH